PQGIVFLPSCPDSGLVAGPQCPNQKLEIYMNHDHPLKECQHQQLDYHLGQAQLATVVNNPFRLLRPLPREMYALDPTLPLDLQMIKAQVQTAPSVEEIIWVLNNQQLARENVGGLTHHSLFLPLHLGDNHLEVLGLKEGDIVERAYVNFQVE
ncbi:MAG: hypothetical protein ACRCTY_00890, partial [Candidatus Adiutrix sp.]